MNLINDIGLIGDFIGTIPIMQELAKKETLHVKIHPEARGIFNLIPERSNIVEDELVHDCQELDLVRAFHYAQKYNLHMTQSYHEQFGLPNPENAIKPFIEFPIIDTESMYGKFDFAIAPFSRSLPEEQKVKREVWQTLVDVMVDRKFVLLGNPLHDDPFFIRGHNVTSVFGRPFYEVCNILDNLNDSVISIVTGISHLCFPFDFPNYLITNQGTSGWGINPEALYLTKPIPEITAKDIIKFIR